MSICEATRKAYSNGCVNLPDMLEALIHARDMHDRRKRVEYLFEAQTLVLDLLGDIQAAIAANLTIETVPAVAQRIKEAVS